MTEGGGGSEKNVALSSRRASGSKKVRGEDLGVAAEFRLRTGKKGLHEMVPYASIDSPERVGLKKGEPGSASFPIYSTRKAEGGLLGIFQPVIKGAWGKRSHYSYKIRREPVLMIWCKLNMKGSHRDFGRIFRREREASIVRAYLFSSLP